MRKQCGPRSQGSRRCRTWSQSLGSLLGCAAECAQTVLSTEMLVRLVFEQPVQFGYRCLVRP
jgi:hypothetical protein